MSHKIYVDSYFTNTEYILQKMFDSPGSELPGVSFLELKKSEYIFSCFSVAQGGFINEKN